MFLRFRVPALSNLKVTPSLLAALCAVAAVASAGAAASAPPARVGGPVVTLLGGASGSGAVAGTASAPTQLTSGVPCSDAIADGTTIGVGYYAFLATSGFSSISIFVTPLAGNPNLWVHVVSTAEGAAYPISPYATGGAAYWTYAVTNVAGIAAVVISANDTDVESSGGKCVHGGSCLFFVAVTGAYNRGAQFIVVASSTYATAAPSPAPTAAAAASAAAAAPLAPGVHFSMLGGAGAPAVQGPPTSPTLLQDSVPYSDSTPDGPSGAGYYSFVATNFAQISVVVTPLSGNPDVFVHVVNAADPPGNLSSPFSAAGQAFWTYAATGNAGISAVVVQATDAAVTGSGGSCTPGGSCPVHIAVAGAYNRGSQFLVTASDGRAGTVLRPGVPQLVGLFFNATSNSQNPTTFSIPVPSGTSRLQENGLQLTFDVSPVGSYGTQTQPTVYVASSFPGPSASGGPCGAGTFPDPTNSSTYYTTVTADPGISGFIDFDDAFANDLCFPFASTGPASTGYWWLTMAPAVSAPKQSLYYIVTYTICAPLPPSGPQLFPVCGAPQQLLDGLASAGTGSYLKVDQYFFNARFDPSANWNTVPSQRTLRISVLPQVGSVQLYARVDGGVPGAASGQYQYASSRFSGENEIVIRANDTNIFNGPCGGNDYSNSSVTCLVTIAAVTVTARSSYQLTARLGAAFQLLNGYPVIDYTPTQGVVTYFFTVTRANTPMNFYLTLESGFAYMVLGSDAFGNNGTNVPLPSVPGSYFINSLQQQTLSIQSLRIQPGDRGFCAAPPCNYYLTVSGGNSTGGAFVVEAKQDNAAGGQLLVLNVPTLDALEGNPSGAQDQSTWNFYYLGYPQASTGTNFLRPTDSVTFALNIRAHSQPNYNPPMVARLFSVASSGSNVNISALSPYGTLDPTVYYRAPAIDGTSRTGLIITPNDVQFNTSCAAAIAQGNANRFNVSCYVALWVLAPPNNDQLVYTLTPFAAARQLVDGQPVRAYAPANGFTYFRYTVGSTGWPNPRPLSIAVAPISGDPDLYVGVASLPNLTSSTLRSDTAGAEVIVITFETSLIRNALRAAGVLGPPFDVYIGVYGYGGPSQFDVSASTLALRQLQDGLAIAGGVAAQTFTYFYFYVPLANTTVNSTDAVGVRISFATVTGSPLIVLVNNRPSVNSTYPYFPRCNNNCPPPPASPIFGNYVYSSLSTGTPGTLDIEPTDSGYVSGVNYIIGVYASQASTFQISAAFLNTVIPLPQGIQQGGTVRPNRYVYYSFNFASQVTSVRFTLQATNLAGGQNPALYSSLSTRRPNAMNFAKFANNPQSIRPDVLSWNSSELQAYAGNFPGNAGVPCVSRGGGCTIYVSVFGLTMGSQALMNFFITAEVIANVSCSSLQGCTELQEGQPVQSSLETFSTDYYYVPVSDVMQPISIMLSPVSGYVDIYATIDGSLPSPTNNQFFSDASAGVDNLFVPASALYGVNASYISVAVYASGGFATPFLSTYFVWFSVCQDNVFTQLPDGVSFDFSNPPGNYYYIYTTSSQADVTFSLTPFGNLGDSDLFVSNYANVASNIAFRPGPNSPNSPNTGNCGNSTQDGADFVTVPRGTGICPRSGAVRSLTVASQSCRDPCAVTQQLIAAVVCYTTCSYSIGAVAGYTTPTLLRDDFPTTLTGMSGVAGTPIIASFDLTGPLGCNRTVSITAQGLNGANVRLIATNAYTVGVSDPTLLPGTPGTGLAQYTVPPPAEQPLPSVTLTITPTDAAILACSLSVCPTLTMGFVLDQAQFPRVTVTASSVGGAPTVLPLGVTSPIFTVAPNVTHVFLINLPNPSKDLVLLVDGFTGSKGLVAMTIDPANPKVTCVPTSADSKYALCNGVWAMPPSNGLSQLRINSSNPCLNSNPYGAPCSTSPNNASYRAGPYYVAVSSMGARVQFTLTATLFGTAVQLLDGVPVTAIADDTVSAFYVFSTPSTSTLSVPVTIWVNTYAVPMVVCVAKGCVAGTCAPWQVNPTPGGSQGRVQCSTLSAYNSGGSYIMPTDPNLACNPTPTQLGLPCLFYVTVNAAASCNPNTGCLGKYDIFGALISGSTPQTVSPNQFYNQPFSFRNVTFFNGQPQFFLFGLDGSRPGDLKMTLEACGQGAVALYATNPDTCFLPTCNPFNPGPGAATDVLRTQGGASRPQAGGRDSRVMSAVQAGSQVFARAFADNSTTRASDGSLGAVGAGPSYNLIVSSGTSYYVAGGIPGQTAGQIFVSLNSAGVTQISWSAAYIVDQNDQVVQPAVFGSVMYTLYIGLGGFNATPGAMAGSKCGLDNYVAAAGPSRTAIYGPTPYTNFSVPPLATAFYEMNVVAQCDRACWLANNLPQGERRVASVLGAGVAGGQTLTQTAPYLVRDVNFAPTVVPTPGPAAAAGAGNAAAAIGGGVGGAVALLCLCGVAGALLRRRGAGYATSRAVRKLMRVQSWTANKADPTPAIPGVDEYHSLADGAGASASAGSCAQGPRALVASPLSSLRLEIAPQHAVAAAH